MYRPVHGMHSCFITILIWDCHSIDHARAFEFEAGLMLVHVLVNHPLLPGTVEEIECRERTATFWSQC